VHLVVERGGGVEVAHGHLRNARVRLTVRVRVRARARARVR
jgi:hypothetical protein